MIASILRSVLRTMEKHVWMFRSINHGGRKATIKTLRQDQLPGAASTSLAVQGEHYASINEALAMLPDYPRKGKHGIINSTPRANPAEIEDMRGSRSQRPAEGKPFREIGDVAGRDQISIRILLVIFSKAT
jgi:hypothetical protein